MAAEYLLQYHDDFGDGTCLKSESAFWQSQTVQNVLRSWRYGGMLRNSHFWWPDHGYKFQCMIETQLHLTDSGFEITITNARPIQTMPWYTKYAK